MPDLAAAAGAPRVPAPRIAMASLVHLPAAELLGRMTPSRSRKAIGLTAWLLGPNQRSTVEAVIEDLCERFLDIGLPIDRYGSSTSMVTAEHDAVSRLWIRGVGVTQSVYVRPEDEDPDYLASPYYESASTGTWVELWLPETKDDRFGIVPDLKQAGYRHYLCAPFKLTNGSDSWVTFATARDTGFGEQDLLTLAFIMPALSTRIDARVGWVTLDKLLRTYVGDEPHTAILAGRAKRGQVSTIRAVTLVADLRDSTGHTATISAVQAVGLFNDLFDCLVPSIEGRGGDVLKYLGDGLLAIFRDADDGFGGAADRALAAAEASFTAVKEFNRAHPDRRPMFIGIALHYGEIAYGNIGSGTRLDFTVIGRDVALASRIAAMNGPLNEPLLMSAAFAAHGRRPAERVGRFPVRGFEGSFEIFRPGDPVPDAQPAAEVSVAPGLPT